MEKEEIINNPYNPRLSTLEQSVLRGDIVDEKGTLLATTEDTGKREYPFGELYAHVIGYSGKTKTGIEGLANNDLLSSTPSIWNWINKNLYGNKPKGNTVYLTINHSLQQYAETLMGGHKGAIILIEPSTGKIKTMVSNPSFDPNQYKEQYDILKEDHENNPLLNRATQGLYPPGSVFKIITALSEVQHDPSYKEYTYECTGEDVFDDNTIHCFNKTAHGIVDLNSSFAYSCNTSFANLGISLGNEALIETAEQLFFNRPLPFPLPSSQSEFQLTVDSPDREMAETAIGQGKTLVTPMHMAIVASIFANRGILMKPYMIDRVENEKNKIVRKTVPNKETEVLPIGQTEPIVEMMKQVVTEGTGRGVKLSDYSTAGKTGTAQNSSGEDHSWFVGFSPVEKPEIGVVVLIENGGTSSGSAVPIAKKILEYFFETKD